MKCHQYPLIVRHVASDHAVCIDKAIRRLTVRFWSVSKPQDVKLEFDRAEIGHASWPQCWRGTGQMPKQGIYDNTQSRAFDSNTEHKQAEQMVSIQFKIQYELSYCHHDVTQDKKITIMIFLVMTICSHVNNLQIWTKLRLFLWTSP